MLISKRFTFEASHILQKHKGKCSRLHGHSWKLLVVVEGSISEESGFVIDYADLSGLVDREIIKRLDHTHLGCGLAQTYSPLHHHEQTWDDPPFGPAFYPSSENLVRAIAKLLQPLVKELASNARLFEVRLEETCTSEACWRFTDESTE